MKNPFIEVLKVFKKYHVRFLLSGGQACIFYGAAEFTRDSDFVILCDSKNINCLKRALRELGAVQVFFPPLEPSFLRKGHACHFVCQRKGLNGFRIDVMSKMRNCPSFSVMWKQRKTVDILNIKNVPLVSINHLVLSKKTQRDKDWPMIRRLIENDYQRTPHPSRQRVYSWLAECRTPEILIDIYEKYRKCFTAFTRRKSVLGTVVSRSIEKIEKALLLEELEERQKDREYWKPLRQELERMRHERWK